MSNFEKLQKMPEEKRLIIFWIIIVLTAISCLILWVEVVGKRIRNIDQKAVQDIKQPFIEEIDNFPQEGIDQSLEQVNDLEKLFEELEKLDSESLE